jgi:hypothetical protein
MGGAQEVVYGHGVSQMVVGECCMSLVVLPRTLKVIRHVARRTGEGRQ